MSHSQKISSFTGQSLLDNADLFTFVRSGTNFNVSFTDFKNDLGVTGTLNQVGDPLGVPVLDQPGGNTNNIRNIESTKGIIASVSAQDGIAIGANFAQSTGGLPIIESLNAPIYNFRTIKAEAPLQVTVEGDSIVIKETGSPLAATNTVIVSTIDDFPTAVGGVITLADDINYVIVQSITTANRFILGANNSLTSNNPFSPLFTYTGSDTFFTGVDVTFYIHEILLNAPSAQVFDMSSTPSSGGNLFVGTLVVIVDCNKFGTFDDLLTIDFNNGGAINANDGITILGNTNWSIFSLTKVSMNTTSVSFIGIDLDSSLHQTLELENLVFRGVAGGIGISGLTNSGNITSGNMAAVQGGEFTGITPISGITVDDVRWGFFGNTNLEDSANEGLIYTQGNALETTINTQGVPEKINAVFIAGDVSRFTSDGTGRLTFIGERGAKLPIDVTATLLFAGGGDKQVELCVAINGVEVSPTCVQETASSSKAAAISTIWQYDFQENDYIEAFIVNQSDTTNIVVTQCIIRVN